MDSSEELNDFDLPIQLVARQLKTTELQILMYIRCGLIEAEETAAGWSLSRSSLGRFLGPTSRVACATGRHCSACPGCRQGAEN